MKGRNIVLIDRKTLQYNVMCKQNQFRTIED